jgi:HD-GYP domain-containing protein (c-di-GMP phosphodiesterase class II)
MAAKLVPFSAKYLRLDEPVPLGVRDAAGRLLLGAGQVISNPAILDELNNQSLFAEEGESVAWTRRLGAVVDEALRNGARLGKVAALRPDPSSVPAAAPVPTTASRLAEQWYELVMQLDATLRDVRPDTDWQSRLNAVHSRARQLFDRRPDASLYHFVYEANHSTHKYSCHHALLVLLICEQAAAVLRWPSEWTDSLGRAALTMNVAMLRLHDQLANTQHAPSAEMRAEIDAHAGAGAEQLQGAGLDDMLCPGVVRLHHDLGPEAQPLEALAPEFQLARMLRRVDIFAAKISRRVTRPPMSPIQAAREACLGDDGKIDQVGSALLKAVGLYPPGSFVELVSGEVGIVVARGRRTNLAYVASLVGASGNPLGEPALRDTIDRRHAVKGAVPAEAVKVRPAHDRLLALR